MRFELEAAHELRDGRVNHERIEDIDVVADENARLRGIEAGRTPHFEFHPREAQDVAKEDARRPVILAWVYDCAEQHEERGHHREVDSTDNPQNYRPQG